MRRAIIATLSLLLGLAAACAGGPSPEELTPGPPTTDVHLIARSIKFDKRALAVPANAQISVTLANQDSGTLHNFAVYTDKSAKEKVFATELMSGRKTESYTFKAPPPGQYYFRCDAHPEMNGTLFVQ